MTKGRSKETDIMVEVIFSPTADAADRLSKAFHILFSAKSGPKEEAPMPEDILSIAREEKSHD